MLVFHNPEEARRDANFKNRPSPHSRWPFLRERSQMRMRTRTPFGRWPQQACLSFLCGKVNRFWPHSRWPPLFPSMGLGRRSLFLLCNTQDGRRSLTFASSETGSAAVRFFLAHTQDGRRSYCYGFRATHKDGRCFFKGSRRRGLWRRATHTQALFF